MTHRAIEVMADEATRQGIEGARQLASEAITQQAVPGPLSALYAASVGSGFQTAMLVAALACAVATLALLTMHRADRPA